MFAVRLHVRLRVRWSLFVYLVANTSVFVDVTVCVFRLCVRVRLCLRLRIRLFVSVRNRVRLHVRLS